MHPIVHIISFTAAGVLITDVILNIYILSRCRKTIKRLCEENSGLCAKNTCLKAENALLHRTLKDTNNELTITTAAKDRVYTELMRRFNQTNEALNRITGAMNDKTLELRETQAKLKSAHDHISVLRVEIVKLNRQLQLAKRPR